MFSLGTFINSVTSRSEHANNIDHSIVMTLMKTLSGDMSPLVRKELVVAIQWIVLAFEHAFLNIAAQETFVLSVQEPSTPGMKRIGSRDRLRVMSPASSHMAIDAVDSSSDRMKRVSSSSSISTTGNPSLSHGHAGSLGTLPGLSYGSVYMKLWAGLCTLDQDPHPEVSELAKVVTSYIRNQIKELTHHRENDSHILASMSLPPSPNRSSYLGESPPTLHPHADLNRLNARSTFPSRSRRTKQTTINEDNESRDMTRKPLVTTDFYQWSCKTFAKPMMRDNSVGDIESKSFYEKEWRYLRNNVIRKEALDEQKRVVYSKLETQAFNTRCAAPPSILQFHPYDQQIAVAGKDSFA